MNTSKPKVLIVSSMPYFQWRGSPIRLGFDLLALTELGYEVDLLTVPVGENRATPGVTIHRVGNPFGAKELPIGPSLHKLIFDVLILFRALRLVRKQRYAVVHGIEDTGVIAWIAARFGGAAMIFEKHSDPASYKGRPLRNVVMTLYRWVEHMVMRRADAIIGTGEGLCDQARAAAPGKPVFHIFDIPSSLVEPDEQRAAAIASRLRAKPDELLVCYGGSFAIYQGIDLLFNCMPYVLDKHPQARFVIIGGTPEEIEARRVWLRNHGIDSHVTFLGKLPPDELPHYLAAMDILLSPRQAGINSPLKLLDYLKVARPIVATDHQAHRMILDDTFAMLVEPTPPAFAEGISWLIADEDTRLRYSATGRRLIDERYNFAEYKRRVSSVYTSVTSPE